MPLMCDLSFLSPNDHASICALGGIKNKKEQKGKRVMALEASTTQARKEMGNGNYCT